MDNKLKNIVSFITAFILTVSACPAVAQAEETQNPDLKALASSLGADTDYLAVVNYKHDEERPVNNENYLHSLYTSSLLEVAYSMAENFSSAVMYGSCAGIAITEILSHNGVISPGDLKEGAETLSEITYDEDIDKIITAYQAEQIHKEFEFYDKFYTISKTEEEKIDNLIHTAEKCMKENRYFLITMRAVDFNHAVCGIGISDGSWTFNDINYDKCILTLDSNMATPEHDAAGFVPEACIYINSETKQIYIPAYDEILDETLTFSIIDDDTLLNYKSLLNPSTKINTDISGLKQISGNILEPENKHINVVALSENGEKSELGDINFGDWAGFAYVKQANSFHADVNNATDNHVELRYIDFDRWINVDLRNKQEDDVYNAQIDMSDDELYILNNNTSNLNTRIQYRMEKDTFNFDPYFWWIFSPAIEDDLKIQPVSEGMLLSSKGHINTSISTYYYTLNEDGTWKSYSMNNFAPENKAVRINSDNDVLVGVKDNEFVYHIDNNNDGVFDTEIQKGDINFNGVFDAADASKILEMYSFCATRTKKSLYDFSQYDYNNDGLVDSSDASSVLAEYAKSATK